jgi:hypothetical protein
MKEEDRKGQASITPIAQVVAITTAPKVEAKKHTQRVSSPVVLLRCLEVFSRLYQFYGFEPSGWINENTLSHWSVCVNELTVSHPFDPWMKFIKYKLAAFYSYWTQQPLPVCPFRTSDHPGVLLGGRASRWARIFCRNSNPIRMSFLTSVLRAGRALERPSKSFLKNAENETRQKLTTSRETAEKVRLRDWSDETVKPQQQYYVTKLDIQRELKRTVHELFDKEEYTINDRVKPFLPSTSANYLRSRSEGGAVGAVLDSFPGLLEGLRTEDPLIQFRVHSEKGEDKHHTQYSIVGRPIGPLIDYTPEWFLKEKVAKALGEESPEHLRQMKHATLPDFHIPQGYDVDVGPVHDRFRQFYWRLLAAAEHEVPIVEPLALAEALKARVISKGPPLTYTALKPLQRKMWSVLACHPTFQLVGTPVTAEIVQNVLGRKLKDGQWYVSGDYKDATNELHSWVSETIADTISEALRLSRAESRLFRRALTEHVFVDENGIRSHQKHGQLMGSVVSFPVLCIANAAMTRFAIEQAESRKVLLRDSPMLINGDDVVFRSNRLSYTLWKSITSLGGLTESVGKTYCSADWLNINSTTFMRRSDAGNTVVLSTVPGMRCLGYDPQCAFAQVPTVNLGLLYGMKRSGGHQGISDVVAGSNKFLTTLGATARELCASAPITLINDLMSYFVCRNLSVLKAVHVPWFMPEWLGGVGLPSFHNPLNGRDMGPTDLDLRKGAFIYSNQLNSIRSGHESSWKTHALVNTRLPERPLPVSKELPESIFMSRQYDKTYAATAVSLLFDSRISLKSLYSTVTDDGIKNLRMNERLWTRAPRLGAGVVSRMRSTLLGERPDVVLGLPIVSFSETYRDPLLSLAS